MGAQIIDGKEISRRILEEIRPRVEALKSRGVSPCLTVILVGEDPASVVYVRNKEKTFAEAGMESRVERMPEETTQAELLMRIDELNRDDTVHGILVQMPLPGHISEDAVLMAVAPGKDVDGFCPVNYGKLFSGQKAFEACTPKGVMELLHRSGISVAGKKAVVVGRSNIVGKPMAFLLLRENATVTICHSKTADLAAETRQADILIVAIRNPRFITGDMIKPGAVVIDVGMNRTPGSKKLKGDVDFESASEIAGYITPVPKGVGPMTITMLVMNTLEAAENATGG